MRQITGIYLELSKKWAVALDEVRIRVWFALLRRRGKTLWCAGHFSATWPHFSSHNLRIFATSSPPYRLRWPLYRCNRLVEIYKMMLISSDLTMSSSQVADDITPPPTSMILNLKSQDCKIKGIHTANERHRLCSTVRCW